MKSVLAVFFVPSLSNLHILSSSSSNVALHLLSGQPILQHMDFDILTIAKNYLKALKAGKTGKELSLFFHPDVIQTELPNRLNTKGVVSNLNQIIERAEKGKKLLKAQTYGIENEVVSGDTVVLEVKWTGVLAIPVASLCAGDTMRARFAMFMQFKNGQIINQRNYSCFEDF